MGDPSARMALSGHQLKWLCEQLLQRRGWAVEASPHDGIDFIARDAEGRRYVVECKAGSSQLQASAIYRLTAQHKLHGTDRALLVTTMTVPARLADEMQALEIELWSSDTLAEAVRGDIELRDGLAQTSPAAIAVEPGQLRIQALEIDGFRGIAQLELPLAERGTTVLAGINGAGKTAVLEALATALSWVFARLANPDGRGRTISDHDIKLGAKHCTITAHAELDGRPLRWSVVGSRPGTRSRPRPELDEINAAVHAIHEGLEQDRDRPLPVAVMYAVNRAVLDIPRRIRKRHEFDRFSAHEGALAHGGTRDFRTFFEWFRDREDLENERRIQQPEHRDPQLIAVREAIETVLDGVSNLRVRRNPQRMVVDKRGGERGEELIVDQLSDGEKCLLATVGDLARRLAVANPGSPAPLREHGVVLIDEIDLHLHPRWQRSVIPDLERTFPNCQLVVTTHSPQVLSHVKGETIRLARSDGLTMLERRSVYGWDTNRILEEFLEVDERPREVKEELDHYFGLIQSGQLEAAQAARERLEGEIGLDEPSFKKADVLLRHRRLLASE
jgi:predicted ATP-binding protein involved in virulence